METRYVKPYFSQVDVNFHNIVVGVPVENSAGQQGYINQDIDPTIKTIITGWIAGKKARVDEFTFTGADLAAINTIAGVLGGNLEEYFVDIFDKIANHFPVTEDQPEGSQGIGPAIYIRPERFAFRADPDTPKSVVITAGVYTDSNFSKRSAYFELVFEDGESKRNRQTRVIQLEQSLEEQLAYANETHPQWEQYSTEQKTQLKQYASINIPNMQKEIDNLNSQVVGSLDDLVGTTEGGDTALQAVCKEFLGVFCGSVLTKIKAENEEYSNINVELIMSEFAIPDVS